MALDPGVRVEARPDGEDGELVALAGLHRDGRRIHPERTNRVRPLRTVVDGTGRARGRVGDAGVAARRRCTTRVTDLRARCERAGHGDVARTGVPAALVVVEQDR